MEKSIYQPAPESSSQDDLSDYTYHLPPELIAQEPLAQRHDSRLLITERLTQSISHYRFSNLPELLQPGDLLVANNTRVIPARLRAQRSTGARIDILLLKPVATNPARWEAMAAPLKKLKIGEELLISAGDDKPSAQRDKPQSVSGTPALAAPVARIHAFIEAPDGQRRVIIDFGAVESVHRTLTEVGLAPLPPYITRNGASDSRQSNLDRYQTIFATAPGAVAAPTAGLHFSPELMERLDERGVQVAYITLHVGPGTFKPIIGALHSHTIEPEWYSITAGSAASINDALEEGRRVIAVGTTSCRALESAGKSGRVQPVTSDYTNLYIRPGHKFNVVQGLITNFHLSRSSLLVLVATFAGRELVMRAYKEAVKERYRFYSYGDAMLIL